MIRARSKIVAKFEIQNYNIITLTLEHDALVGVFDEFKYILK